MKTHGKIFLCVILMFFISVSLCVSCTASGASNIPTEEDTSVISYGLQVLANQSDMVVTGISGQTLNFSERNFMSGMNLSDIESIQITRLPASVGGVLYYDSQPVTEGQIIQGDSISRMTFSASEGFGGSESFNFKVNGSSYENVCKIFMISSVNTSPTTESASYASLNIETHKNISTSGVLYGYDAEGDELTFEVVKYPEDGIVKITDKHRGTYTYIPGKNYSGRDGFTYVVRDKYGNFSSATTVSVSVCVPSVSVFYSDLEDSSIHTYALDLTEEGIMNGVQVGEYFYFKPEVEVSRAEFIVTAMNALGIKNVPDVADTGFFDDGDIRPEMKGYIALAYSKGYISGQKKDGEVCFFPDETIKLSEAAVILSNIIGYSEPQVKPVFSDSASIPAWSERAIISLHTLGVLESSDGSIEAGKTVDRGTMAKLLSRAMFITGN